MLITRVIYTRYVITLSSYMASSNDNLCYICQFMRNSQKIMNFNRKSCKSSKCNFRLTQKEYKTYKYDRTSVFHWNIYWNISIGGGTFEKLSNIYYLTWFRDFPNSEKEFELDNEKFETFEFEPGFYYLIWPVDRSSYGTYNSLFPDIQ